MPMFGWDMDRLFNTTYLHTIQRGHSHKQEDTIQDGHWDELQDWREEHGETDHKEHYYTSNTLLPASSWQ